MVSITSDGYLINPEKWDRDIAQKLASYEKITNLSEKHWEVIMFIRDYFQDFKVIPAVQKICAHTNLKTIEIYLLFPNGPKEAYRVAGMTQEIVTTKNVSIGR
ncbi:MAG: hypothetical protein JM58_16195 [Peptococcaceae bacterium BICA1-8]|nr:MAG: hypothetical protein JM58_16195 [Peptococcaceae bacterium BICA1-8]